VTQRRDGVAGGGEEWKGKWSTGKIHAVLASLSNSINTAYSWVTGKSPAAATPTSAREREREREREQEWVKRKKGVKREGVYERQAQKWERESKREQFLQAPLLSAVCVCVSEVCGGTVSWSWATAVKARGGGRRGECCALEFSTGKRNNTNPASQITSDWKPSDISAGSTPLATCRKLWAHLIETGPGE